MAHSKQVKKILFITSNRLGDAVLSTGLYEAMHYAYPEAKISVACGPLAVSIFEGFPNLGQIYSLKKQKHAGHWFKLWRQVIGTKWDIVVDLRNSFVSRMILAKQRHIYGPHIGKTRHKVEQNAQVMRLNNLTAPKIYHTPPQLKKAEEIMPKDKVVIGVGPAANWRGKTWPKERFIEVIQHLTKADGVFPDAHVAVFAAPGEEETSRPVLSSVPKERQIDGIAKGTPGEVAAMISKCDIYIGNDSGLMHSAAACGVPTVGLFGPSYPELYAPWGDHTVYARTPETFDELIDYEGYTPQSAQCLMTSLKTSTVIDTIERFWAQYAKIKSI